jgi:hypothetical protein
LSFELADYLGIQLLDVNAIGIRHRPAESGIQMARVIVIHRAMSFHSLRICCNGNKDCGVAQMLHQLSLEMRSRVIVRFYIQYICNATS